MTEKIENNCQKQEIMKNWEDCEYIVRTSLEGILNNKFDSQEEIDKYIKYCIETFEAILPMGFDQTGILLFWVRLIRNYTFNVDILDEFEYKLINSMLFAMKISSEITGEDGKFLIHPITKVTIDREDGTLGEVYIDKNLHIKVKTNGFLNFGIKLYNNRVKFWENCLNDNANKK